MLRYSPQYYSFIANSTNVVFNNFDISGYSSSSNEAKNTDGWDTYRSSDITIMNSLINNGDGTSGPGPLFNCSFIRSPVPSVPYRVCLGPSGLPLGSLWAPWRPD